MKPNERKMVALTPEAHRALMNFAITHLRYGQTLSDAVLLLVKRGKI